MPIRPEMRARYPKDWAVRSRFVRFMRARNRCEGCGIANGTVLPMRCCGEPAIGSAHPGRCASCGTRVPRVVLTTAHVYDHRPEAASLLNLAAWCQKCHNRHDAAMRRAGIRARREAASGQGRLFA